MLGLLCIASCRTAPVPVNDQQVLDLARLSLPDTYPQSLAGEGLFPRHPRTEAALRSMGFSWNDPRFTAGHRLIRDDEVAWFDREGRLHVTRYTGIFQAAGYRIRRYFPSESGDLEHRGWHIRSNILLCLYDRPASALRFHHYLSGVSLTIETLISGPIDTLILPFTIPLCILSDRLPSTFSKAQPHEDSATARKARRRARKLPQKGNPIPTKVTAPASVE
ncbi:MAG: hypothetical protein ACYDBP_01525 [Leptospirales bacterium]